MFSGPPSVCLFPPKTAWDAFNRCWMLCQPAQRYLLCPETVNQREERVSQGLNPIPHHQIALMEKTGKLKHLPQESRSECVGVSWTLPYTGSRAPVCPQSLRCLHRDLTSWVIVRGLCKWDFPFPTFSMSVTSLLCPLCHCVACLSMLPSCPFIMIFIFFFFSY